MAQDRVFRIDSGAEFGFLSLLERRRPRRNPGKDRRARESAAMKAAICYEFGKPLVIEEIEIDPPQAGEVKVRLAACAICYSDIHYMWSS